MKYRPEIDGLRAVAVLSVILYHAGATWISAGYAGVDVFFVISGFLLGGIVLEEKAQGNFSYRQFYARRIRRIFPALLVMVIVSLMVGWVFMIPEEYRYFGAGALTAILSLSNIWFYDRIDYFTPEAAHDPLIHTWSLGIEEQFYLILPILLSLLLLAGANIARIGLALIALISFAWAVSTSHYLQKEAFYLLHTRLWELLVGVIIAAYRNELSKLDGKLGAVLSTFGLMMIIGGILFIPKAANWPGIWTLIPVIGTMLYIAFGQHKSPLQPLMRSRGMVGIGLVSYSAYLWHQPILGFMKLDGRSLNGAVEVAAFVVLVFVLAWISWRFIEQPMRKNTLSKPVRLSLMWGGVLTVFAIAIGGHITEGYPARIPAAYQKLADREQMRPQGFMECIEVRTDEGFTRSIDDLCVHGTAEREIAIWGDSHVGSVAKPLGETLSQYDIALREISTSSCHPIPSLINVSQRRAEQCTIQAQRVQEWLLRERPEVVILYAFWNSYIQHQDYDNGMGTIERDSFYAVPWPEVGKISETQRLDAIEEAMIASWAELVEAGIKPIVILPIHAPGYDVPNVMLRRTWRSGQEPVDVDMPQKNFDVYSENSRRIMRSACQRSGAVCVDLAEAFCDGSSCDVVSNGQPLFYDGNHLSLWGAERFIFALMKSGVIDKNKVAAEW